MRSPIELMNLSFKVPKGAICWHYRTNGAAAIDSVRNAGQSKNKPDAGKIDIRRGPVH